MKHVKFIGQVSLMLAVVSAYSVQSVHAAVINGNVMMRKAPNFRPAQLAFEYGPEGEMNLISSISRIASKLQLSVAEHGHSALTYPQVAVFLEKITNRLTLINVSKSSTPLGLYTIIRTATQLSHPAIAHILEFGTSFKVPGFDRIQALTMQIVEAKETEVIDGDASLEPHEPTAALLQAYRMGKKMWDGNDFPTHEGQYIKFPGDKPL